LSVESTFQRGRGGRESSLPRKAGIWLNAEASKRTYYQAKETEGKKIFLSLGGQIGREDHNIWGTPVMESARP